MDAPGMEEHASGRVRVDPPSVRDAVRLAMTQNKLLVVYADMQSELCSDFREQVWDRVSDRDGFVFVRVVDGAQDALFLRQTFPPAGEMSEADASRVLVIGPSGRVLSEYKLSTENARDESLFQRELSNAQASYMAMLLVAASASAAAVAPAPTSTSTSGSASGQDRSQAQSATSEARYMESVISAPAPSPTDFSGMPLEPAVLPAECGNAPPAEQTVLESQSASRRDQARQRVGALQAAKQAERERLQRQIEADRRERLSRSSVGRKVPASIDAEPASNSGRESREQDTRIALRLPSGQTITAVLPDSSRVQSLQSLVKRENGLSRFRLVKMGIDRQVLGDPFKTLREVGLTPSAVVLVVQDQAETSALRNLVSKLSDWFYTFVNFMRTRMGANVPSAARDTGPGSSSAPPKRPAQSAKPGSSRRFMTVADLQASESNAQARPAKPPRADGKDPAPFYNGNSTVGMNRGDEDDETKENK
ncbi:hypothetical protein FVE85_1408 [Porphyridium purpureum]|uniref:UBX domain-containing protein n=1 Tax=Porphyridium purpureum TaxID=35688 RepID=A0A5J4YX61_PORPP|nr:hypothetical protein FVE85_1408 [Porphyridium purpureum]|eukprot:POR3523..scf209_3